MTETDSGVEARDPHETPAAFLDPAPDAALDPGESFARAEWDAYCRSGRKPVHIPDRPDLMYAEAWESWSHWLAWVGLPAGGDSRPADQALWA
jgi:hypothetical protein